MGIPNQTIPVPKPVPATTPVTTPIGNPDAGVATSTVKAITIRGDVNNTTGGEVYDPRKRTFIEEPKSEVCPHCGQKMPPKIRKMSSEMNYYVNAQNAVLAINSSENILTIKGVEFGKVTSKTYDPTTGNTVYNSVYLQPTK